MSRAILLLPLWAFMTCFRVKFTFTFVLFTWCVTIPKDELHSADAGCCFRYSCYFHIHVTLNVYEFEDCCLVRCDLVQSGRTVTTFQSTLQPTLSCCWRWKYQDAQSPPCEHQIPLIWHFGYSVGRHIASASAARTRRRATGGSGGVPGGPPW